jgi:hypothetical protein
MWWRQLYIMSIDYTVIIKNNDVIRSKFSIGYEISRVSCE